MEASICGISEGEQIKAEKGKNYFGKLIMEGHIIEEAQLVGLYSNLFES